MSRPLLVVGVGNRDRGDDAVGPTVCDRLDRLGDPAIVTHVVETGGTELLHAWTTDDDVVVVDAASPDGHPGRITRLDGVDAMSPHASSLSTHAVDVSAWLELGRVVGMLPRRLQVVAVEGCEFEHGEALTEPVERAVGDVLTLIGAIARTPLRPSALPRTR